MGIKLGDISPFAGLVSGKGMFGDLGRDLGIDYGDTVDIKAAEKKKAEDKARVAAAGAKCGGSIKKMAKGGSVSSASKRADGCATKGKTRGKFV